jgi:hypothetical protein
MTRPRCGAPSGCSMPSPAILKLLGDETIRGRE